MGYSRATPSVPLVFVQPQILFWAP